MPVSCPCPNVVSLSWGRCSARTDRLRCAVASSLRTAWPGCRGGWRFQSCAKRAGDADGGGRTWSADGLPVTLGALGCPRIPRKSQFFVAVKGLLACSMRSSARLEWCRDWTAGPTKPNREWTVMAGAKDKRTREQFGEVRSTEFGVAEQEFCPDGSRSLPAEPPRQHDPFHGSSKWETPYRRMTT